MAYLKRALSIPAVRYGVLAVGSGLWVLGLIDQASAEAAMKYLLVSLLVAVVAIL
jgi:hypothetical protein